MTGNWTRYTRRLYRLWPARECGFSTGRLEEVRRTQTIAITATIDNALTWGRSIIGLMEFAREGLCSEIMPMPMAGSYDPVTLAGTLVQGNAEILAAVVLSQLISPGAPMAKKTY